MDSRGLGVFIFFFESLLQLLESLPVLLKFVQRVGTYAFASSATMLHILFQKLPLTGLLLHLEEELRFLPGWQTLLLRQGSSAIED